MDVNRALRSAANTGTVVIGLRQTGQAVAEKQAKLVILAENAPEADVKNIESAAKTNGVPIYRFQGRNTELGPACGKPFSVAALAVIEAGESDVLALAHEG